MNYEAEAHKIFTGLRRRTFVSHVLGLAVAVVPLPVPHISFSWDRQTRLTHPVLFAGPGYPASEAVGHFRVERWPSRRGSELEKDREEG